MGPSQRGLIKSLVHVPSIRRNTRDLKVHKIDNFFGFDFEFCTISLLDMLKYQHFGKNA
jgi:hypothetical protein